MLDYIQVYVPYTRSQEDPMRSHLTLYALLSIATTPCLALSGKIVDAYGVGKPGVVVTAGSTTATTDANGAWSIGGTTNIMDRTIPTQVLGGGHLAMEHGRLALNYHGYAINGQPVLGKTITARSALVSGITARTVGATLDTFTYSWNGKVFLRDTTSDLTRSGLVANFDTTINGSVLYGWINDARDGKIYRTVKIGSQVWMAQNLNFTPPSAGDSSWCLMYDEESYCATYGRTYSWPTAMSIPQRYADTLWGGSDLKHQGICPKGWHLPSISEWRRLTDTTLEFATAGTKLKAKSSLWKINRGTDDYGFAALPGGKYYFGRVRLIGSYSWFCTATEINALYTYDPFMILNENIVSLNSQLKQGNGYSIRCIQD